MTLLRLAEATSTNDEARRLAVDGAPHGTAVCADRQTGGRGRLGRTWVSPDGAVALSIVIRRDLPPERVALVCLAAAVATARCCGPSWRIKWPNDVVDAEGRKVAGILAEAEWSGGRLRFVVLGIGVNVTSAPELPGRELPATSLAAAGPAPERHAFAEHLATEVLAWTDRLGDDRGVEEVLAAWRGRSATLGRRVAVGDVVGTALDIDGAGALTVQLHDGSVRRILAGDVVMVG